jgi:hypothetical protein
MELFRREALDGQDRLHGDVVFVPQVSWRLLAAFFAAALSVAAVYLVTAHHRPVVQATGRLAARDGALVAIFEVRGLAAEALAPGQELRLSAPGTSRRLEARIGALLPSGDGATIVHANLHGDGAETRLRPGMTIRAALPTRPRTLAAWIFDSLVGSRQR